MAVVKMTEMKCAVNTSNNEVFTLIMTNDDEHSIKIKPSAAVLSSCCEENGKHC